jgi:NAD(P)-dependent dehydrogenase (short-subunit alcohol dehydrogenase family)
MSRLHNQRILITGSSRGLGRAFARATAAQGAQVMVNGTNAEAVAAAVEDIRQAGGRAEAFIGSVAEPDTCQAMVQATVDAFGGIDVLVNNAGIVRDRTLMKMSAEEFDAVINVHLRGAWACTKYAALEMKPAGGGHIVQIISASGLSGGFGQGNYAAAKAGMMGLLRTALIEFASSNIRCNAFWPIADTDMTQVVFERARQAAQSQGAEPPAPAAMGFGQPDEVAQGMVWLLGPSAAHFNGQCITFNGRKVALWTHPTEVAESFSEDPWTVEDLDAWGADAPLQAVHRPRLVP